MFYKGNGVCIVRHGQSTWAYCMYSVYHDTYFACCPLSCFAFYYAFCYMAQLIPRKFSCLMLFTFSLQDEQTRNVYLSRHWLSLYYNCFSPGPLFTNDFACSHGGQSRLCAYCQFLCTFFCYCSYIAILITLLHSGLVSGCA